MLNGFFLVWAYDIVAPEFFLPFDLYVIGFAVKNDNHSASAP